MKVSFGQLLGRDEEAEFDLEILVRTRILINTNSGGGKSYAIRKLLEVSHGKVQQVVIDLEGEFASLREKFAYLLVGKGGDIQANAKTAPLLARRILENSGTSVIIDLSELKKHERTHYVRLFLESLVESPRDLWHPVLVVVDEAHHFCPEQEEAESEPAVIDLMTRGRKRGLCGCLATQRLSKLNKDAAAEANNILIGRTTLDIDQKRASDVLGFTTKDQARALRELEPGTFHAFGPAFASGVNLVKVGRVVTTHPEVGMKGLAMLPPPAPEKIKSVLPKFSDLPQEAEQELKDKEALQHEVRQLRLKVRQLESSKGNISPENLKAIEDKAFSIGEHVAKTAADRDIQFLRGLVAKLKTALERISKSAAETAGIQVPEIPAYAPKQIRAYAPVQKAAHQAPLPPRPVQATLADAGEKPLKDGAMRMLKAAAMWHPEPISKDQMGTLAGFAVNGGTFGDYLSALRKRAFIVERNGDVQITEEGLEAAGPVDPLPTDPQELLALWKPKFKAGAAKMLEIVVASYPESISMSDLGEKSGYPSDGGTFGDYLSMLRRNGLVVKEGDQVRASPAFFPQEVFAR